MTTEEVRRGGLEVWAPSKVPPIGVELTDEQQMAIAFRHLGDIGFAERNFWFCAVEDQSSFIQYERIGADNILLEADYPHCDSTWPHTQRTIHEQINGLPDDIIRKVTWENASRLYQHPVPAAVQADPNAF